MNYYTESAFEIPVAGDQRQWLTERLEKILAGDVEVFPAEIKLDEGECPQADFEYEVSDTGIIITFTQGDAIAPLCKAIADLQTTFGIDTPQTFEWSYSADRLKPDTRGGGAALIYRGAIKMLDTDQWLTAQLQAIRDGNFAAGKE